MSTLTGKRKYRVNARFYGNCGFHHHVGSQCGQLVVNIKSAAHEVYLVNQSYLGHDK